MKINEKIFALVLLVSFATQTLAVSATSQLVSLLKNIITIQGKFTQAVYDQDNNAIATSKGLFMLQRPNHFRWQEKEPLQQLTVANGKNIWFYQPDLQQVNIISTLDEHIKQTPLAILSDSTMALDENYSITQTNTNHFILSSKAKNAEFCRIALSFINNKIQQMILFDNLGQKTIINFKQTRLNQVIAKDKFQFIIPKNIDVINH